MCFCVVVVFRCVAVLYGVFVCGLNMLFVLCVCLCCLVFVAVCLVGVLLVWFLGGALL